MSEQDYHDQVQRFKGANVALLRADIDAIRCNKELRVHERKRGVSKLVATDLIRRGRFIQTHSADLYFFDSVQKTLELLDSAGFQAALYDRYGLNRTEDETRFVEADLVTFARTREERSHVYQVSHWDDGEQILYVSANDGTMFVLDGRNIERVDNGQRGVLFRSDRRATPC